MTSLTTISDSYRELNAKLHASPRKFGGDGAKHAPNVIGLASDFEVKTILDYGCGQAFLKESLKEEPFHVVNYDPAIPEHSAKPEGIFDLVACTDVLEHVEPEYLNNVLQEIFGYTGKVCYLVIACIEANKTLADGRNAHLIQRQPPWWINTLHRLRWKIIREHRRPDKHRPELTKKLTVVLEKLP